MKKNYIIKAFRISKETNDLLQEATKNLPFKKTNLIRFLLNRALRQLKSDSLKAGGYKNLNITLREI